MGPSTCCCPPTCSPRARTFRRAQAVVAHDMPWNPQRVVQRNGRVIRLRSPHDVVLLTTMLPEPGELERLPWPGGSDSSKDRRGRRLRHGVRGDRGRNKKDSSAPTTSFAYTQSGLPKGMWSCLLTPSRNRARSWGSISAGCWREHSKRVRSTACSSFRGVWARASVRARAGAPQARRESSWQCALGHPAPIPKGVGTGATLSSTTSDWSLVTWRYCAGWIRTEESRCVTASGRSISTKRAWKLASDDVVATHNARANVREEQEQIGPRQRWALRVLREFRASLRRPGPRAGRGRAVGGAQLCRPKGSWSGGEPSARRRA